jgi:glycosyltransferase involved in cell wall biosynthesis
LAEEGYDVSLVVAGATSEEINGVKVIGYTKNMGGRVRRMIHTSFFDMLKVCRSLNADIYHFHDPELIFVGLYLKLLGKKVIYDIHENNPASILSKPYIKSEWAKKTLSMAFDLFERTTVGFFDALVTARPDIIKRFKHHNMITLRNFPILPDFSKINNIAIKKTKPSVIFVGGMTPLRGINELLDAFTTLDEYELWLLGPVNDSALKQRIEKQPKNVKYFGVVEAFEIFAYIQAADAGIITFLPAPNHMETLATKPFEYMACGKPMIMSDFPYWRETFGNSAIYVNPTDPQGIAESVKKLFLDKEKMISMGKFNQRLATEEYNWNREKEKLLNLYKDLH